MSVGTPAVPLSEEEERTLVGVYKEPEEIGKSVIIELTDN